MSSIGLLPAVVVCITYCAIIFVIVSRAYNKTHSNQDFILGSRQLGAFVTALGAGASDMSGWVMMAFPGLVYRYGVSQLWLPLGLIIGAYANWRFVAPKLREATERYEALTIPSYLERCVTEGRRDYLQCVTGLIFLLFFVVYAAAGFVGLALAANTISGIDYDSALIVCGIFVVFYTCMGGYLAVNWVDVFQGCLMLFALLAMPLFAIMSSTTVMPTHFNQVLPTEYLNVWSTHTSTLSIISLLTWGLGYFGQLHILVRFMGAKRIEDTHIARRISMGWMVLSLIGAFMIGCVGRILFDQPRLTNPETVFIQLIELLLNPWFACIFLMAILSSITSTLAAQLLMSASALAEDIFPARVYAKLPISALSRQRLSVALLSVIAMSLAANPDSHIFDLVSIAWAGLGAAFGPGILCSLYLTRLRASALVTSMLTGGATIFIWLLFQWILPTHTIFHLYSLLPGFAAGTLALFIANHYPHKAAK